MISNKPCALEDFRVDAYCSRDLVSLRLLFGNLENTFQVFPQCVKPYNRKFALNAK